MKPAPNPPNFKSAARNTLRRRNLRREIAEDSKMRQVRYGGVVYLWYAAPIYMYVDLAHSVYKIGDRFMAFLLLLFFY